jgi:hypothetical protein
MYRTSAPVGEAAGVVAAAVVVSATVVVSAAVVVAAVVVSAPVVVTSVDAPVVSELVEDALVVPAEVEVAVESVSVFRTENGSHPASAPDAINPSSSIATSPAATLAHLNPVLLVRDSTVFPLSSPQFLLTVLVFRPLPVIVDSSLRVGEQKRRRAKGSHLGCLTRLAARPLSH